MAAAVSPEGVAQDMQVLRQEVPDFATSCDRIKVPITDQRHTHPAPTQGPGTHPARRTLDAGSRAPWSSATT